ncbi:MAG: hypothetical protein MZW92_66010 [Comamonadaceae bacterium]|nr:hypothetical protein [Comamonadaceae bacterium]
MHGPEASFQRERIGQRVGVDAGRVLRQLPASARARPLPRRRRRAGS